jgi:alkaline phosphatase
MDTLRRYLEQASVYRLIVVGLVLVLCASAAQAAAKEPRNKPLAKNIIVMISDGWGFNHLEAASYYEYGKDARQVYNRFPFSYAVSTYAAYAEGHVCHEHGYDPGLAWNEFDYVMDCQTDSAAAATALSTGVKTYNGAVGVDPDGAALLHAVEIAEQLGKSTGVVSSVPFSHATPAAFVAHNSNRNNYAEIAREMIYDSAVDVIMGCGNPWYDANGQPRNLPGTFDYVGGQTTWDDLVAGTAGGDADGDGSDDPWMLVQEGAAFQSLATGPTPPRVLGVPQVSRTLQEERGGDPHANPYVVPFVANVPTLEEMTAAALNILDDDPDGLFLMIEGGAIDWAAHGNRSGRMIEEQIDFERSVEAAVDWVKRNSNWGETLLIVTGDHETGYLTGPGSDPTWEPIVNNGAGNLPGMEWHSRGHTNSLLVVSAKGDAARLLHDYADEVDPLRGYYVDNTELGLILFRTMAPAHDP